MIDIAFDISGIERSAHEAVRQLNPALSDGVEAGLPHIVANAQGTSAFIDRSGKLRASIRTAHELVDNSDGVSGFVTADAGHAKFIEGGTKKAKARPFLGPAGDQELGRATDEVVTELEAMFRRSGF